MRWYSRVASLRLDHEEWFDATVPTRDSNAGGVKPFRRMLVHTIELRDNIDGAAPRIHAEGRWYKANGALSAGGQARSTLPWDQMPESIQSAVSVVMRTYRITGRDS